MYDIKLLQTPTGNKLLRLLDRMERMISILYHASKNELDDEYIKIHEEVNKLKELRRNKLSKRQIINKSY